MEPGVPFALLGTVQLLAVAAWVLLAAVPLASRRASGAVTGLLVLGPLVLAGSEVWSAVAFGESGADGVVLTRAAGAGLLGLGLLLSVPSALPVVSVVVPLAAAPGPAAVAALATGAAAGAAWWRSQQRLLAVGLLVAAFSAGLTGAVGDSEAIATLVVVLRGVAAVLVLAELLRAARRSLLAKVVATTLAGVLAVAVAAVGVVGSVVVQSYDDQARQLVREAAADRLAAINRVIDAARAFAPIAEEACRVGRCEPAREQFVSSETAGDFVVQVNRAGQTASLGGRTPLSTAERLGLVRDPTVQAVFAQPLRLNEVISAVVRLVGSPPGLAAIAIKVDREQDPRDAVIYGVRLDDAYTANDVAAGVYGLSFLVGDQVVASNLSAGERAVVARIAEQNDVASGLGVDPSQGLTVPAQGSSPTVHFAFVSAQDGTTLGVIALSRDADLALAAQRRALTYLLATALLVTALVAVLAVLVGRRTVEPVRRLTFAASRVSAGDLYASAEVSSVDEVGTLSRTFDAMTGSLLQLTDDLRASATRLQTVLSSMSDGLVATDADDRITSINPAALALVGLADESEALDRRVGEVLQLVDGAGLPVLSTDGQLLDVSADVVRGEARTPVRVARTALEGTAGEEGSVIVLRDTTREREVERMKTEFLSNVSHELKTPMTSIYGYAQMLSNKRGLPAEQVAEFASVIVSESVKMNRVTELLVDVNAIEAGRMTVSPRPVRVGDLLDARVLAWAQRAPTRASGIKRRAAAGLPPVMVDPTWVAKALDELIDNAVKYSLPSKAITLVAGRHGDAVRVTVKDAGPGIAEADQQLLFTPFEQVDGSATRRVGGLGLGLYFVRKVAEVAGFAMSFTSTVGKGSEFSLDLPISEVPAPRRASRAARPPALARGRAR